MNKMYKLVFCALLALSVSIKVYAGPPSNIIIYYTAHNNYQESLAYDINNSLSNAISDLSVRFVTDKDITIINPDDLIISIGYQKAIKRKIESLKNDVIYVNDTPDNTLKNHKNHIDIKITQPPCRQLRLISSINKRWKRIGYLMSKPDDTRLAELKKCSIEMGLSIKSTVVVNGDIPAAIDKLLPQCDVLLALPDYSIYNSYSVKNILLSAYRLRIPVIGFSKNFVRAGALAATYSTPQQIARQIRNIVIYRAKHKTLPAISINYPEYFSVSTNNQVAYALNLPLPTDNKIKQSIEHMEAKQ